jgi:hypothetical protein
MATTTQHYTTGIYTSECNVNRGYSMLFDEYEMYFMSEAGFLIFSRVQSTSENIIKILSHE